MAIIPDFNYTYNGDIVEEILVRNDKVKYPIETWSKVYTDIQSQLQISLAQGKRGILREDTCEAKDSTDPLDLNNVTLVTKKVYMQHNDCALDSMYGEWLERYLRTNNDLNNLTNNNPFKLALQETMQMMAGRDLNDLLWFGDDSDANAFYGIMDGLWTQFIADAGTANTDSIIKAPLDISSYALGTKGNGLAILRDLYENQSYTLRNSLGNKIIAVTTNVYDAVFRDYTDGNYLDGLSLLKEGEGRKLTYRGIEIQDRSDWSASLEDSNNPQNGTYDILACMYEKDNVFTGFDANGMNLRTWYSEDDDNYKIRMKFGAGAVYGQPQSIIVNYGAIS